MQREGVVGWIGFTFLPSWATLYAVVQPAVSPSPAAPLCWVFCLCPRELVGPAGLCAKELGRRCRCGPWQAIRPLISQSSSFVLGTRKRQLQPLWLGKRARAAGGSSRFGFVKLSSGFVLGARCRPIQPQGLGTLVHACAQAADSAALGLGHSQAALCLENAHPAGPALGERSPQSQRLYAWGPIQPPWA